MNNLYLLWATTEHGERTVAQVFWSQRDAIRKANHLNFHTDEEGNNISAGRILNCVFTVTALTLPAMPNEKETER